MSTPEATTLPTTLPTDAWQAQLCEAGAAAHDPVGWHYAQLLAARTRQERGPVQAQLLVKLQAALQALAHGLANSAPKVSTVASTVASTGASPLATPIATPSPALAALVAQRLRLQKAQADTTASVWSAAPSASQDSPRVRQVRRQLGRMRVQKQLSQALAQAPQNAGPINSQMLVLRALALLRERSPEYLNRLMTEVDTLLCLEDAERQRLAPKPASASRARKPAPKAPDRA